MFHFTKDRQGAGRPCRPGGVRRHVRSHGGAERRASHRARWSDQTQRRRRRRRRQLRSM